MESVPPTYVVWGAGTSNKVIVPARQAGYRFLGSLKGLEIPALGEICVGMKDPSSMRLPWRTQNRASIYRLPCILVSINNLYICFAQCVEQGKNWFFYTESLPCWSRQWSLYFTLYFSALQRQNAENVKLIFPEMKYRGLCPNFHIHVSVSELYISMMVLPFLLEQIYGPILGIYKSLTDTCMWKLGLRPCNPQKRNI